MAKKFKTHPEAEIFPMMGDADLAELVESIKDRGLFSPIELIDGKIIDGRNRCKACRLAGVEPTFVDVTEKLEGVDKLDYVFDQNDIRRHLTLTQRATAAANYSRLKSVKEKADENQKKHLKAGDSSSGSFDPDEESKKATYVGAKKFGVSEASTKRAAKVLQDGAKATVTAMESGDVSLNKAAEIAKLPKSEQPAAVKEAKKPKNGSIKPNKQTLFRICEKSFGELYRSSLKLGISEEKYGHHFEAIIKEVNRLGGKK